MELISISPCPTTKLNRKCFYDFLWSQKRQSITIKCFVSHFDKNGDLVNTTGTQDYTRDLVASKDLVHKDTGELVTDEEKAVEGFDAGSELYTTQYLYYVKVAENPINLPEMIFDFIRLGDSKGKLDAVKL